MLVFCVAKWQRGGMDPRTGVLIARDDATACHSKVRMRYLQRMGGDYRCFWADLLSLAVDGSLSIGGGMDCFQDKRELQQTPSADAAPGREAQRALPSWLLVGGSDKNQLDSSSTGKVFDSKQAHRSQLVKRCSPIVFALPGGSIAIALLLAVGSSVIALAVSGGGGRVPSGGGGGR